MTKRRGWRVHVARQAWTDLADILEWTARTFGARQSRTYEKTITVAIEALGSGPDTPGARQRDEIGRGLHSLHVTRGRRTGRHFLFFSVNEDGRQVTVLRILYDGMDFPQHFANDDQD